jgi:hypothetical protein
VFYDRVEVQGLEQLPPTGPVLLFANHANAIADAVILTAVDPVLDGEGEDDVRALTAGMEAAAGEVTLNSESWETLDFLQQVERFVALRRGRYRKATLSQRFRALRRLLAMERTLRREHPDVVEDLQARLSGFRDLCREFGVRDAYLTVRVTPLVAVLFVLRTLFVVLAAMPVAAWGWLNAVMPFLLTRHAARALSKGLFWGAQAWWVYDRFGVSWGCVYLLSLPVAASTALAVARERRRIRENLRAFFRVVTRGHVRDMLMEHRGEIERDLSGLARRIRRGIRNNEDPVR